MVLAFLLIVKVVTLLYVYVCMCLIPNAHNEQIYLKNKKYSTKLLFLSLFIVYWLQKLLNAVKFQSME